METYGKILLIAMPIFLMLVLLEKWYGYLKGNDTVRTMDMISSLSSGVTNVTKDVLGLSVAIISYGWMHKHLGMLSMQESIWMYLIAFLALDFSSYWIHRIQHTRNIFWNAHIIHHSSEEYNLACALRQSISVFFRIFTFFLLPAAVLGIPPQVIAVVAPLHLFAQFWYHTQHIDKMGMLEHILVTPSHHRVHHAINPEYIDKNYAAIFIFWDKLFKTFQEEKKEIRPVYGITVPVSTWNPIKINFQHMMLLVSDAWRTKNTEDKLKIWFMPTGWRPLDVAEKYPRPAITNVYQFKKYAPGTVPGLQAWSIIQLLVLLLFISHLFANISTIGSPGMFMYGLFIFSFVYAMTELMDRNQGAPYWEAIKGIAGWVLLVYTGGWFGAEQSIAWLPYCIGAYFMVAVGASIYFTHRK